MPRATKKWIGKSDDSKPPPRVRMRVYDSHNGRCHICSLPIEAAKGFECDHVIALANGGANAEDNLAPAHIPCHADKTRRDVKEKAKVNRTRQKHIGIKDPPKMQGQGFTQPPGTAERAAKRKQKAEALQPLPPRRLYQ